MLLMAGTAGVISGPMWLTVTWLTLAQVVFFIFFIYMTMGGYKQLNIVIKTLPRDAKAAFGYIRLLSKIFMYQRRNMTVPKVFSETVRRHPKKTCFIFEDDYWTFAQVEEYANKIGNYFSKQGIKRGDTVAVLMENCPEYVCTWLGLSKIGAVPALINYNLRLQPLLHSITVAESKAVVYGIELQDALKDILNDLPVIPLYCSKAGSSATNLIEKAINLDSQLAHTSASVPLSQADGSFSDKLIYIYTSGTTGLPKAAVIRHARFFMMSMGVFSLYSFDSSDILYDPLPLYHTAGGMIGAGLCLLGGVTLVVRQKFSVSAFWPDCIKHHCTAAQYIGEICRYLLSAPPRPEDTQHQLRVMFGNGLRPQIWEAFVKRFNVPWIGEFYGATEGNANIINIDNKVGAVGFISRILPWVYPINLIRVDDETGEPLRDSNGLCIRCRAGEAGELVGKIVAGHPIRNFDGYADEKATRKKIITDVFKKGDMAFLSGDILTTDDLGYLYFKDRTGDTFRWRGENVATSEVEAVISNITGLRDSVVYGVEVPGAEGKAGMAAILDPDSSTDIKLLSEGVKKSLPPYARPLFVRIVKELDQTGTYKMKKIDIQKEGYNPYTIHDSLYYLNAGAGLYEPLTEDVYNNITGGKMRL